MAKFHCVCVMSAAHKCVYYWALYSCRMSKLQISGAENMFTLGWAITEPHTNAQKWRPCHVRACMWLVVAAAPDSSRGGNSLTCYLQRNCWFIHKVEICWLWCWWWCCLWIL